jgi:hypothetical protein
MKNFRIAVGLVFFALSACVSIPEYPSNNEPTTAQQQKTKNLAATPQYEIDCDDGRVFMLTLAQDQVTLKFLDSPTAEVLDNNHVAEGVEFANTSYILRQYSGTITLIDLTQDRAKMTRCHRPR